MPDEMLNWMSLRSNEVIFQIEKQWTSSAESWAPFKNKQFVSLCQSLLSGGCPAASPASI